MKTQTIYLTTLLLVSTSPAVLGDMAAPSTTDAIELRYGNPGDNAKLSVFNDISTDSHKSMANFNFLMDFELSEAPRAVAIGIDKVKGSYTAHDMTQRLPVSGLKGQSFFLEKADDDRVLLRTDSDSKLQINLGEMIGVKYSIGLALADILPFLPEQPVTLGSTWESTRDTRSLEGWAWVEGRLSSEHVVTAVDELDGHTIVSITSIAYAQLSDVVGGVDYSGDGELKRTSHWRFDATEGRLLSVSMVQETSGLNTLPQGTFDVRQQTKVEFSTTKL